jgi:molybdate transport system ATP-binding protein
VLDIYLRKRLKNFTLELELAAPPGITALFGPSGAGKSMTLACVAGLTRPDDGRIVLNGDVLFDSTRRINLPPQRRAVGYMMQDYLLFPHLDVGPEYRLWPDWPIPAGKGQGDYGSLAAGRAGRF